MSRRMNQHQPDPPSPRTNSPCYHSLSRNFTLWESASATPILKIPYLSVPAFDLSPFLLPLLRSILFRSEPGESRSHMSRPRKPGRATKGTIDYLISQVQNAGYKFHQSRKAVHAVIDHIKLALARGEAVEVPYGWLVVRRATQRRVWRLGRIVDIPKHPWTITLRKRATEPRRRKVKVKAPVPHPRYPAQVTFASPTWRRPQVPSRTRGFDR